MEHMYFAVACKVKHANGEFGALLGLGVVVVLELCASVKEQVTTSNVIHSEVVVLVINDLVACEQLAEEIVSFENVLMSTMVRPL